MLETLPRMEFQVHSRVEDLGICRIYTYNMKNVTNAPNIS